MTSRPDTPPTNNLNSMNEPERSLRIPDDLIRTPVYWWTYADHDHVRALNPGLTDPDYVDRLPLDGFAKGILLEHFSEGAKPPRTGTAMVKGWIRGLA